MHQYQEKLIVMETLQELFLESQVFPVHVRVQELFITLNYVIALPVIYYYPVVLVVRQ
jgi:hypothetical protein